jgi:hypothetical protein
MARSRGSHIHHELCARQAAGSGGNIQIRLIYRNLGVIYDDGEPMNPRFFFKPLILLNILALPLLALGSPEHFQERIRQAGDDMLENLEVSYVYGGSKVGDVGTCDDCNSCLEKKRPAPKLRFKECPSCHHCSLDCSHFVQLVFERAGLGFPYLTSTQMLDLNSEALLKKYNLRAIEFRPDDLVIGDLLVYRGHVVIVERLHEAGIADIIHATGGKDIKEPGQGIQRERFVRVSNFRGPLLRILRHENLITGAVNSARSSVSQSPARHVKLRPVEKRRAE